MKTINCTDKLSKSCIAVILLLAVSACEDFLQIDPPRTEIVKANTFTSDASAFSALNGIYSLMMSNVTFTRGGIEELTGLASDELLNYSANPDQVQFFNNTLAPRNGLVLQTFWSEAYRYISNANAVLEGMSLATGLSEAGFRQIKGEALFIRAFSHFYLAALFGDVPYLTTTDYRINAVASRLGVDEVYNRIAQDLEDAKELLSAEYSFSQGERIRPNKSAAAALLARVYLYLKQWEQAETEASEVIDNSLYALPEDLNVVFRASSPEAIWQLKPVMPNTNSPQAQLFILVTPPNSASRRVTVRDQFVTSFEPNDDRASAWIGSLTGTSTWYYPFKYKALATSPAIEYNTVFRLGEQYLIRAEARAMQANFDGAAADLDVIRLRAGLDPTEADDLDSLIAAIIDERKHELFAEWGHRWLDLKRLGALEGVMNPLKADWQASDALFPIPESERLLNPNLEQNPGY